MDQLKTTKSTKIIHHENFYAYGIVKPGMYFQKVKFHVSGYNLRHTPHILILFFAHGYTHVSVHICTKVTMATTTIISQMVYLWFLVFSYLVLYTFEFFNNFLVDERSHQARQFVVPDL